MLLESNWTVKIVFDWSSQYQQSLLYSTKHDHSVVPIYFKEKQQPPRSQTELHERFVLFVLLTIFCHFKKERVPVKDIKDLTCLPKQHALTLYKLSLLAHKCLVEEKIVLQYPDINNICPNFDKIPGAMNRFGLLQAVQSFSFNQLKQNISLNFLHYSVQEFLAAFCVTNLNAFNKVWYCEKHFG